MSKTTKKQFKYTPTHNLKPLKKVKTKWDLRGLYYTSEKDPQIEKDIRATERAYAAFAKKWRDSDFAVDPVQLKKALKEYEKLAGMPAASRPGRYFGFRSVLNAKDDVAEKQLALLSKRLRKASNQILFFTLTLGKLPKQKQKEHLANADLQHYHYFLERVFLGATHTLSESEERVIRLKDGAAQSSWVNATEKILSNRKVTFKGKQMHIPEALELLDSYKLQDRRKLWKNILTELEQIGEFAEHELNAIINDTTQEDELRGFKKPYSATALAYEDTEESIENIVEIVSDRGFKLSQKFYKHKAKLAGKKQLHYTEKYQPLGSIPEIPFTEAVEICRDVFYGVKTEYGEIFDSMLTNGQIDVFPQAGKRGGAFMSEQVGHPTHVFLNHTSTFKALETLAHEMGHAIHAERSKHLSPLYQGHSITTAETASTLFENLVFDALYEQATDEQKKLLLHDRIARDIATTQRQIAFFNCELEMHTAIAQKGGMTNEELRACMEKHLKSYLGPGVEVTKEDGYSYVYVGHLRYGFYVYTYTFGILMSTAMANRYKADASYIENIDTFLSLGESDDVAGIFKQIGIDVTDKSVMADALKNHEKDITNFIKLTS